MNSIGKLLTLVVLTGLIAGACGQSKTPAPVTSPPNGTRQAAKPVQESDWDRLVAAAKKEGKVMIYSSQLGTQIRDTVEPFKKKYGIKVDFLIGRGEELTQRLQTEKSAGLYIADVVIAGATVLVVTMKPLGILGSIEPLLVLPEVTDPKAWITDTVPFMDKDRTGFSMIASFQRFVLINTDLVSQGEITSYKDILNSRWKGRMVYFDPTITGSGNAFIRVLATDVWGLEGTKDFMRQLAKQDPAFTREKRLSAEWVARAKHPVGIAPDRGVVIDLMRAGAPIVFVKAAEGGITGTSGGGLGVVARMANPNATRLFVNWLLSREGHASFIRVY
ncbi:MAG: extracellular solute-binding protein, partial [Chloroflexi bacterium]|nr:extracellular solute-binding protein [Chloroflexota bacterium]